MLAVKDPWTDPPFSASKTWRALSIGTPALETGKSEDLYVHHDRLQGFSWRNCISALRNPKFWELYVFLQLFQTWSRCLMSYHTTPVSFCNLTRHQRRQGLSQGCWGDFVSPPGTVWAIRPSKTDGEIWNNTTASANIPAMNMNISGQNCKNRDFQNSPPILPCWDFTVKPFAPLLRYPFPQDLGTIHHTSSHQFCRWLYQLHSFRIASQWVLFDCLSTQMTDSLGKPKKKTALNSDSYTQLQPGLKDPQKDRVAHPEPQDGDPFWTPGYLMILANCLRVFANPVLFQLQNLWKISMSSPSSMFNCWVPGWRFSWTFTNRSPVEQDDQTPVTFDQKSHMIPTLQIDLGSSWRGVLKSMRCITQSLDLTYFSYVCSCLTFQP